MRMRHARLVLVYLPLRTGAYTSPYHHCNNYQMSQLIIETFITTPSYLDTCLISNLLLHDVFPMSLRLAQSRAR
jgi:hypothetical protein